MMREIKFRVWSTIKDPKMIPWVQLWNGSMGDIRESESWRVMQYIGLKDKNGVEIYEGDIVYLAGYGDYTVYSDEFPFFELYEAGAENDIGEIKGNVYENPELL